MNSWSNTKGNAARATSQDTFRPMTVSTVIGTTTAQTAGAKVWAKKTSIRSTSLVARDSRSPERDVALTLGGAGDEGAEDLAAQQLEGLEGHQVAEELLDVAQGRLEQGQPAMTARTGQMAATGASVATARPARATA